MSDTDIRLECARLTVAAGQAGFTGDYASLFAQILESVMSSQPSGQ